MENIAAVCQPSGPAEPDPVPVGPVTVGPEALGSVQLGPAPVGVEIAERGLSPARADILDRVIAAGSGAPACLDAPTPGRTVAAIAAETGQHENTVREHLEALVQAGLVARRRGSASGRGRPAIVYVARSGGTLAGKAREYAGLAGALAGQIARTSADPKADAISAGYAWGVALVGSAEADRAADPRSPGDGSPGKGSPGKGSAGRIVRRRVVAVLDELGFAPTGNPDATKVRLARCPLLEVAKQYPEVVCWVHLGLARGMLAALGGDPDRTEVYPFAEPGVCRLDLLTRPAA